MPNRRRIERDLHAQLNVALEQGDRRKAERLARYLQQLQGGAWPQIPGMLEPHRGRAPRLLDGGFGDGAPAAGSAPPSHANSGWTEDSGRRVGLQPGDRNIIMRFGEALRGPEVREMFRLHDSDIKAAAEEFGVDETVIKAIIFEERTHQLPLEAEAEAWGFGRTVGPGQITVGLLDGYTRQELLDPATNIRAMAEHIATLQSQPLIDPDYPVASIATRYNSGDRNWISDYGRRVESYYNYFR